MSDGNGDLEKAKISEEELKKKFEENVQNYKDFVTAGTVLIVRLNEYGTPQWITSLQPADLNLLLDRMKFVILNPKPIEAPLIEKPKGIIADIKGAFGKKRF